MKGANSLQEESFSFVESIQILKACKREITCSLKRCSRRQQILSLSIGLVYPDMAVDASSGGGLLLV